MNPEQVPAVILADCQLAFLEDLEAKWKRTRRPAIKFALNMTRVAIPRRKALELVREELKIRRRFR